MLGILAGMDQENTYAVGWFLSTAPRIWQSLVRCASWFDSGYMLRQSTAASMWRLLKLFRIHRNAWFDIHLGDDFVELLVFSTMLGSTVALGDYFVEMVVFSAMLGSASVYACFWKNLVFLRDGEPGSRGRGLHLEIITLFQQAALMTSVMVFLP